MAVAAASVAAVTAAAADVMAPAAAVGGSGAAAEAQAATAISCVVQCRFAEMLNRHMSTPGRESGKSQCKNDYLSSIVSNGLYGGGSGIEEG